MDAEERRVRSVGHRSKRNHHFLPAAGGWLREVLDEVGSWGYYLSRTLYSRDSSGAYNLEFDSEYLNWDEEYRYRYYGYTVRPVRVQN